ncbi:nitroreductase family protein [Alkaliphilus peptidifermentans]|uniref:Nitroreductase n=1 Tax=Alkaliphilus peptidifermentans DSM 18978 TaxID=1120976 RepID=A0A1G5L3L7_9FIRM|nr:nitroreductase family protein [Alkaliphilus peptidifermentans]SCZ07447.1 Nitroreductase [Alkaliphilus peptidifermentans DSM 18978]
MSTLDFIFKRHSVRKFKDLTVPEEDLRELIKAATLAPSGKNTQNWHFVIVRNKEKINEVAEIIESKTHELAALSDNDDLKKSLLKFLHYHTFFKNAPILILVFAGPYPIASYELLLSANRNEEANKVLSAAPGIQNIGAAMENLLLAAASLGYGTCWMTGPNYAAKEIEEYIGFSKEGYSLVAMTPLGVPEESELTSPARKDLDEVLTIID